MTGHVLTQGNDNARTGAYIWEPKLTPANVNALSFGCLYSRHVDGQIVAQPLYVADLPIDGVQKNVFYIATRTNKVYAFDADNLDRNPASGMVWQRELRDTTLHTVFDPATRQESVFIEEAAPLPGMEDGPHPCGQTHGPVGITSTPVIDPQTNTMYLVFRVGLPPDRDHSDAVYKKHPEYYKVDAHYWLSAIDIRTGQDRLAPIEITHPEFDPNMQLNRPGLLLLNGVIYLGWGAVVCDSGGNPWLPYHQKSKSHGWIFAYRAHDLQLLDVFNTTQHTALAGIWQSGHGLTGDVDGNVYAMTGNNGTDCYNDVDNSGDKWILANDPAHLTELGESILKLRLGRNNKLIVEHFTAENWFTLDTGSPSPGVPATGSGDSDLGSGGVVLLSNGWLLGGGKQGKIYIIDPKHMQNAKQQFQAFYNTWHPDRNPCDYDKDQSYGPNIHGSPILWHPVGVNYALIYAMPEKEYLKAFRIYDDGHVEEHPAMTTMEIGVRSPQGMPGGFLSLSANGGSNGILWVSVPRQDAADASTTHGQILGRLIAFDALTLNELWYADDEVRFAKFAVPTVAGGRVFRAAYSDKIIVYGLGGRACGGVIRGRAAIAPRRITAVWRNSNHLDLFMTSASGTIMSAFWEGETSCGWQGWRGWFPVNPAVGPQEDVGNTIPGQPVTAVWNNPNHLDLFITAQDGTIRSTFWEEYLFSLDVGLAGQLDQKQVSATLRQQFQARNQPLTPQIQVKVNQPGRYWTIVDGRAEYGIRRENNVLNVYWEANGGWRDWFPISPSTGRAAPGQPVTAVWSNPDHDHFDLFITAQDGTVLTTFWKANGSWRAWFPISPSTGRAAPGQPVTAVWSNPNHLDLFITAQDGTVLTTFWEFVDGWRAWFPISPSTGRAAPGQPLTAVWSNPDHLDLFITAQDGTVLSTFWEFVDGWRAWFAI